MSRTARALIAGLAAAGVLVVGAGAAYAEDSDSSASYQRPSTRSADPDTGLLGSLPVTLPLGL